MVYPPELAQDHVFIVVPDTWTFYDKAGLESVLPLPSAQTPTKQPSMDSLDRTKFMSLSKRVVQWPPPQQWPQPLNHPHSTTRPYLSNFWHIVAYNVPLSCFWQQHDAIQWLTQLKYVVAGLIVIDSHLDVLIYATIDLVAYSCLIGGYPWSGIQLTPHQLHVQALWIAVGEN
jgi:hypothetical protein